MILPVKLRILRFIIFISIPFLNP